MGYDSPILITETLTGAISPFRGLVPQTLRVTEAVSGVLSPWRGWIQRPIAVTEVVTGRLTTVIAPQVPLRATVVEMIDLGSVGYVTLTHKKRQRWNER